MQTPPRNEAASSPPCLNCGAAVSGNYCASCGQETRVRKKSLGLLLHELVENVFNLDSKLVRSLVPLLFRPGFLTRVYLDGKRASYVLPLRLYLISSVLLLLGFSLPRPNAENMVVTIGGVKVSSDREIQPAEPTGQGADPAGQGADPTEPAGGESGAVNRPTRRVTTSLDLLTFSRDTAVGRFLDDTFKDKQEELRKKDPQVIVELYFSKLEASIPKALFLLMPLFALVLKILFLRSRILYFDHLIFALHFHSFIFLVCLAAYVFQRPLAMALFILAVSCVYLFLAVRRVYRRSLAGTLVRTAALVLAYLPLCAVSSLVILLYASLTL